MAKIIKSALVTAPVDGEMDVIGVIDFTENGFQFQTKEPRLAGFLGSVKREGLLVWMPSPKLAGEDIYCDSKGRVKIAASNFELLQQPLNDQGYDLWYKE